jgi:D-alanine-D-alanine ligase
MGLNIAVLANLKKNAPHTPGMSSDAWDDLDSDITVESVIHALESLGHRANFLEGNISLAETLPRLKPDICFNFSEGHWGDSREAHVPAILEMLRIPYTGSKVLTLALTLDKPMTKRVLRFHELPTPPFQVFERADEPLNEDMTFPLFVKPSREGTGMGVAGDSICNSEVELRERLAGHADRYQQPILVEHFIRGREITVGALGNLIPPVAWRVPDDESADRVIRGLEFLPPLEVDFAAYPETERGVYTNRMKTEWAHDFHFFCPAPLDPGLISQLNWLTAAAMRVTGTVDLARVDFRLDADHNNEPYILEVNPLPGLYPGLSDLVLEAEAGGIGYNELIAKILRAACHRQGVICD